MRTAPNTLAGAQASITTHQVVVVRATANHWGPATIRTWDGRLLWTFTRTPNGWAWNHLENEHGRTITVNLPPQALDAEHSAALDAAAAAATR